MSYLFQHGFAAGLGPFVSRPSRSAHLPSADDCVSVSRGRLVLRMRRNPLRVGHVWVPPEEFSFNHGFVEARMRFPSPPGSHGCGWLQSEPPYDTPEHHEVDYAEHFGNPKVVHHGIWWRPEGHDFDDLEQIKGSTRVADADAWAVWGVECRTDGYTFTYNDKPTVEIPSPSSAPKALVFSMLSDDWERQRTPLDMNALWAHNVKVDWVRVSSL